VDEREAAKRRHPSRRRQHHMSHWPAVVTALGGHQRLDRLCPHGQSHPDVTSLVRSLLSVRGPKQVELARKIGMSEASMSHIMSPSKTRQRAWQIHEVRAIAEYYGISTDALLGDATAREKVLKKLRDEAAKRVNATD
jgi:hypothetical protein